MASNTGVPECLATTVKRGHANGQYVISLKKRIKINWESSGAKHGATVASDQAGSPPLVDLSIPPK